MNDSFFILFSFSLVWTLPDDQCDKLALHSASYANFHVIHSWTVDHGPFGADCIGRGIHRPAELQLTIHVNDPDCQGAKDHNAGKRDNTNMGYTSKLAFCPSAVMLCTDSECL